MLLAAMALVATAMATVPSAEAGYYKVGCNLDRCDYEAAGQDGSIPLVGNPGGLPNCGFPEGDYIVAVGCWIEQLP